MTQENGISNCGLRTLMVARPVCIRVSKDNGEILRVLESETMVDGALPIIKNAMHHKKVSSERSMHKWRDKIYYIEYIKSSHSQVLQCSNHTLIASSII